MFYTLWWKRDRILYSGKTVHEQRVEVFKRAGLKHRTVKSLEELASWLPPNTHYSMKGGGETQSYARYLLAPRIQVRDSDCRLVIGDDAITVEGVDARAGAKDEPRHGWRGVLLSVVILAGISALFLKSLRGLRLSVPESAALGATAVCIVVVLTRAMASGFSAAGWILAMAGVGGLTWLVSDWIRRARHGAGSEEAGGARSGRPAATMLKVGAVAAVAAALVTSVFMSVV
ncbi:MAG: hypothetical protein C0404_09070, partial [Verrucomicrobia bacterium]|nr:hypothetical protein [Verrucomicrobiota bacterium]